MKTTLTIADVAERYAVSESTIARWHKQGAIPPPVRIGGHAIRWFAATLDEFDLELVTKQGTFPPSEECKESKVSV